MGTVHNVRIYCGRLLLPDALPLIGIGTQRGGAWVQVILSLALSSFHPFITSG